MPWLRCNYSRSGSREYVLFFKANLYPTRNIYLIRQLNIEHYQIHTLSLHVVQSKRYSRHSFHLVLIIHPRLSSGSDLRHSPLALFIKIDSLHMVLWSALISFIAYSSPEVVIRSEGYRTGILRVASHGMRHANCAVRTYANGKGRRRERSR